MEMYLEYLLESLAYVPDNRTLSGYEDARPRDLLRL